MPIKGMTTREAVRPRFTRIGKLKKGKMEDGRPVDLTYFRFIGEGADKEKIEETFYNAYGPKPRRIRVYLPHRTAEENWSTWNEEWGKSGLIHRCDGEYMVRWLNPEDKTYVNDPDMSTETPCPYASGEKERTPSNPGCEPIGRLPVMIPELLEEGFVGYVVFECGSKNDLPNLTASIFDAEDKAEAALRPNGLQGIEFVLKRQREEIGVRYEKTKKVNGKRIGTGEYVKTRKKKWMVRLDPAREWALKQLEAARKLSLGQKQEPEPPALPGEYTEVEVEDVDLKPDEDEEREIVREVAGKDRAEAAAKEAEFKESAEQKHGVSSMGEGMPAILMDMKWYSWAEAIVERRPEYEGVESVLARIQDVSGKEYQPWQEWSNAEAVACWEMLAQ